MSKLVQDFQNAVNAWNAAQTAADYTNLVAQYLDANVIMNEVDPPHTAHHGTADTTKYLAATQPGEQPQFWPDYKNLVEVPTITDVVTSAAAYGPALYQDSSVAGSAPIQIRYHFEFVRPNITSDWKIKFASAK